jgi:hypothetical protein
MTGRLLFFNVGTISSLLDDEGSKASSSQVMLLRSWNDWAAEGRYSGWS